ncbi:serine/threonine protein kinase [Actinomadura algeriensis]|uniref:Ser/Thr protein kinase n=1 Tax=Actinomadura algeriensis TaxID=1679523 RepID=A0ABR9JRG5_9ACTN|nr:serine/threonine-protein kinase [Actinomadura algeriensis]MBE1533155.1 putative Ser/Thr protein kinase [Actinomadura algeriensis]
MSASSLQGAPDESGEHARESGDPESIGKWRILGRLGAGGMGVVYLGEDAAGEKVAIKVINPGMVDVPGARSRFKTEVNYAASVASSCTARVLSHGETDGRPYLVTEYIAGPSLTDYVKSEGVFPPDALRGLAAGVATALKAVHARKLVHRDIKPGNVLLAADGPRVIDFGIARALDGHPHHTQTNALIGSPGYVAPELLFSSEKATTAADIFSWGTLVAYAATGRNPFGEGKLAELASRAQAKEYDLSGVPSDLVPIVEAALEPDPARRPTVEALLVQLVGDHAAPEATTASITGWPPGSLPPFGSATTVVDPPASGHGGPTLRGVLVCLALFALAAGLVLTPAGSTGQRLAYRLVLCACAAVVVLGVWFGVGGKRREPPLRAAPIGLIVAALVLAGGAYAALDAHGDRKVRLTVVGGGKNVGDGEERKIQVHAPASVRRTHLRVRVKTTPAYEHSGCGYLAEVDVTPVLDGVRRDRAEVSLTAGTGRDIELGGGWRRVELVARVHSECPVDLGFESGVLHDDIWWLP